MAEDKNEVKSDGLYDLISAGYEAKKPNEAPFMKDKKEYSNLYAYVKAYRNLATELGTTNCDTIHKKMLERKAELKLPSSMDSMVELQSLFRYAMAYSGTKGSFPTKEDILYAYTEYNKKREEDFADTKKKVEDGEKDLAKAIKERNSLRRKRNGWILSQFACFNTGAIAVGGIAALITAIASGAFVGVAATSLAGIGAIATTVLGVTLGLKGLRAWWEKSKINRKLRKEDLKKQKDKVKELQKAQEKNTKAFEKINSRREKDAAVFLEDEITSAAPTLAEEALPVASTVRSKESGLEDIKDPTLAPSLEREDVSGLTPAESTSKTATTTKRTLPVASEIANEYESELYPDMKEKSRAYVLNGVSAVATKLANSYAPDFGPEKSKYYGDEDTRAKDTAEFLKSPIENNDNTADLLYASTLTAEELGVTEEQKKAIDRLAYKAYEKVGAKVEKLDKKGKVFIAYSAYHGADKAKSYLEEEKQEFASSVTESAETFAAVSEEGKQDNVDRLIEDIDKNLAEGKPADLSNPAIKDLLVSITSQGNKGEASRDAAYRIVKHLEDKKIEVPVNLKKVVADYKKKAMKDEQKRRDDEAVARKKANEQQAFNDVVSFVITNKNILEYQPFEIEKVLNAAKDVEKLNNIPDVEDKGEFIDRIAQIRTSSRLNKDFQKQIEADENVKKLIDDEEITSNEDISRAEKRMKKEYVENFLKETKPGPFSKKTLSSIDGKKNEEKRAKIAEIAECMDYLNADDIGKENYDKVVERAAALKVYVDSHLATEEEKKKYVEALGKFEDFKADVEALARKEAEDAVAEAFGTVKKEPSKAETVEEAPVTEVEETPADTAEEKKPEEEAIEEPKAEDVEEAEKEVKETPAEFTPADKVEEETSEEGEETKFVMDDGDKIYNSTEEEKNEPGEEYEEVFELSDEDKEDLIIYTSFGDDVEENNTESESVTYVDDSEVLKLVGDADETEVIGTSSETTDLEYDPEYEEIFDVSDEDVTIYTSFGDEDVNPEVTSTEMVEEEKAVEEVVEEKKPNKKEKKTITKVTPEEIANATGENAAMQNPPTSLGTNNGENKKSRVRARKTPREDTGESGK